MKYDACLGTFKGWQEQFLILEDREVSNEELKFCKDTVVVFIYRLSGFFVRYVRICNTGIYQGNGIWYREVIVDLDDGRKIGILSAWYENTSFMSAFIVLDGIFLYSSDKLNKWIKDIGVRDYIEFVDCCREWIFS